MTHSVQTDLSHFKRDNTTQTYLPKYVYRHTKFQYIPFLYICRTQVTQTKTEDSSSVPKPSTYIAGLRGQVIPPVKVDLTLSIETHNNITT